MNEKNVKPISGHRILGTNRCHSRSLHSTSQWCPSHGPAQFHPGAGWGRCPRSPGNRRVQDIALPFWKRKKEKKKEEERKDQDRKIQGRNSKERVNGSSMGVGVGGTKSRKNKAEWYSTKSNRREREKKRDSKEKKNQRRNICLYSAVNKEERGGKGSLWDLFKWRGDQEDERRSGLNKLHPLVVPSFSSDFSAIWISRIRHILGRHYSKKKRKKSLAVSKSTKNGWTSFLWFGSTPPACDFVFVSVQILCASLSVCLRKVWGNGHERDRWWWH